MENRAGMVSNIRRFDLGRRLAAYAASTVLASLIYVSWLTVSTAFFWSGRTTHHDWIFGFGFAVVFWLTGGFALALLLMIVP
jgi:hypothetical protein